MLLLSRIILLPLLAAALSIAAPGECTANAPPLADSILHLPVAAQAALFEKMADDVSLPDAQIAAACRRRADIAFAERNYAVALRYYRRAGGFEKTPGVCRLLAARAARLGGKRDEEETLLQSVADEGEGDVQNEARVTLAGEAVDRRDYAEALSLLKKVPLSSRSTSFVVTALLARLTCARNLGMKDSVAVVESALRPFRATMLECDKVREVRVLKSNPAIVRKELSTESDPWTYAVRLGPFTTRSRALALRKKLTLRVGKSPLGYAVLGKPPRYFLEIGGFNSRSASERFGREQVQERGVEYEIIRAKKKESGARSQEKKRIVSPLDPLSTSGEGKAR
jgi:hypothetical protein